MLVRDLAYDLLVQYSTYHDGDLIDVTWLLNYVLIAVAALHPSMARTRSANRAVAQAASAGRRSSPSPASSRRPCC